MSANVIVTINEDIPTQKLGFEVRAVSNEATNLETAIAIRMLPFIESILAGFERDVQLNEERNKEIEDAEKSRIILP